MKKQCTILAVLIAVIFNMSGYSTKPDTLSTYEAADFYVAYSGSEADVTTVFSPGILLKLNLAKRGPNSVFDFNSFRHRDFYDVNYSMADKRNFDTDFLSPYIVKAINNADGDIADSEDFTGGNHCYNNTGGGASPTARSVINSVRINGVQYKQYSGGASDITVNYTNYVQATNTKNTAGTGREVLKEDVILSYDGIKWNVSWTVTALEDIVISRYYGLQFPGVAMFDTVCYAENDCENISYPIKQSSSSTTAACNKMLFSGSYLNLEMSMNFDELSQRCDFGTKSYSAFSADYGKSYFNLINEENPLTLKAEESIHFNGYYKFYK